MPATLVFVAVTCAATPASGYTQPDPAAEAPRGVRSEQKATAPAHLEGLWPSPKLMELMLARWAEKLGQRYELDDAQRARVRQAVTKRWSRFLSENRATIQPIVNELLEMRLELKPPAKKRVQAWARRAAPVFEKFREQLEMGTAEFRDVLTPSQRATFELDALQFRAGMSSARQKLAQWQKGEYEEDDFWKSPYGDRPGHAAEGRGRELQAAHSHPDSAGPGRGPATPRSATGTTGGPSPGTSAPPSAERPDQIAVELQAWDDYVDGFIRLYSLNEGQRDAVLSVLAEMKGRALAHRDRRRIEIAKLEQRISAFAGSEAEFSDLTDQLTKLYGPIDEMFKELKRRIEQVPTAAQQAEAVRAAK